jgi:hypothetical protein
MVLLSLAQNKVMQSAAGFRISPAFVKDRPRERLKDGLTGGRGIVKPAA